MSTGMVGAKELGAAIEFAVEHHRGQVDKSGMPYILHCMRVMNAVLPLGFDHAIVAICHDAIEDLYSADYSAGFKAFEGKVTGNPYILTAMDLLTHRKEDSYVEYIKKIPANEIARAVKLADLRDNSDITRLKGVSEKDIKRIKKYHACYLFLSGQGDKLLGAFE